MRVRLVLHAVVLCLLLVPVLSAQDAVKVDPKHYTVISENAEVRILKIHYGPHEKSIMHSHPDSVAVALNDSTVLFTLPGGKTEKLELQGRTGGVYPGWHALARKHRRQRDGHNPGRTERQVGHGELGYEVIRWKRVVSARLH